MEQTTQTELARELDKLCQSRRLTLNAVAVRAGISYAHLRTMAMSPNPKPGIDILFRIADTFREPRLRWLRAGGYADFADAILEAQGFEEVPVLGTVAAGPEGSSVLDEPGTVVVPNGFLQGADIALPVVGDSMDPNYPAGSIVAVKLTRRVPHKGPVVVLLPTGEHVLKRWLDTPDGPKLASDNPAYEPLDPSEAQIVGVPIRVYMAEVRDAS